MYVISYDIEKNKVRNKIAKELENYGRRVQYSVFECDISDAKCRELYRKLTKLMKEEETGNIRFYNICKNCEKKIATIGIAPKKQETGEDGVIII